MTIRLYIKLYYIFIRSEDMDTNIRKKNASIWAFLGSFGPKMQSFRDHQVTTLFEDYQILSFRNAISFLIKQRTV